MAYVLNGSNGEGFGFEKSIANFALRAVHESQGLVNLTTVVAPTQGNVFEIPKFAPITYQDYDPSANSGTGDATEQNPALTQSSITATPAVAQTAFDVFYGYTTSFPLAASLGAELGESFAEKVDQRVAAAFTGFKSTPGNTNYATSADGFTRPSALGAMELLAAGDTASAPTAGFTATSVLELVRLVKANWKKARLPGSPVIILDIDTQTRLLGELTGGAVSQSGGADLSALGNELLTSGMIQNIYGCTLAFSTFLPSASRTVDGTASTAVTVGAYFGDQGLYTVLKSGLELKMGEKPGGLQMWLTGLGYFGAGVGDQRRGGAINIVV